MTQKETTEIFLVSVVVLLLVLIVLMILFWIFKLSRNRNLTVLKISAGRPAHVMTITTDPDHAQQMLDHLLDRVYLQVELGAGSEEERAEEDGAESAEEHGASPSGPELSGASLLSRAVNTLHDRLSKSITDAIHPKAPPASPPPSSDQNQTNNLHPEESHHASLSS